MKQTNPELVLANDFVQYTNRNIFLTGKAGTGKTTFLHNLKSTSNKRMVVVAPTGVAAINAGGVTIHSFFQMPFGPIITKQVAGENSPSVTPGLANKFNGTKINIIKSLDLLVIDEISMVRADLLDGIDEVLRCYKDKHLPFGGVQLLMIGDLQQLAPVVKSDEWRILSPYYKNFFFFQSKALQESKAVSVELKYIYRQKDQYFIKILNEVRDDKLSEASVKELNKRYIPDFNPQKKDGYITLTTHNSNAQRINDRELKKLKEATFSNIANVTGKFSEHSYPTDYKLSLKKGAQVMFVKNDESYEKRYYNGKIGVVTTITDTNIYVKCKGDESSIEVSKMTWDNLKYSIDEKTKEIKEEIVGTFEQYPLRLAWAITIHKSQGLTFEKAIIDAHAAFAHGQTYVALSRCKSLEGLVLSSKISTKGIICDLEVKKFNTRVKNHQPDKNQLEESKKIYHLFLLNEMFDYHAIQYQIKRCIKILYENKNNFQGDLLEHLNEVKPKIDKAFIEVANKFSFQMKRLMTDISIENNAPLQERIKKASEYFLEHTEKELVELFENSSFVTDNNATEKLINQCAKKIEAAVIIKQECLKDCIKGYEVERFANVRAKAALKKPKLKIRTKIVTKDIVTNHPVLYRQLQEWRELRAEKDDVAPNSIITQKIVVAVTNNLPTTTQELKNIKGIGKKKLIEYGSDILEIVVAFKN